ncbi:hypothetical protein ABPG74_021138 [Tetrahymena malaccensis]
MKSFKLQLQIASLLKSIVDRQRQISSYRRNLLEIVGFTPYYAFCLVDVNKNKYITNKELSDFLKQNSFYKSEKEISDYLQFRTQNETLLSYNEFCQLVQSHPKQVVECSLEVQNTQREKIKSSLAKFFDLLIESHTIIKKLKKDITNDSNLDYYELQLLLDPENQNNITFERIKKFMDDCSKPFQQEDFQFLIQHVSLSSERLKFKDFLNYMSDKKVTSVVVTNRSRSSSPQKDQSRYTLYESLREDTINPNHTQSFAHTQNSLYQRSTYDSKFRESPSKIYNNNQSYSSSYIRNSPQKVNFDKTNYSSSISSSYYSPQNNRNHNMSYTQQASRLYSPSVQQQQQQQYISQKNAYNNNSYGCPNCSSTSPQNYNYSTADGNQLSSSLSNFRKSPTKNEKYEPSLFKDPSIYYKKEQSDLFQQQLNATFNNMTRIPNQDYSTSKIQFTNFKTNNNDQDTINLSPREVDNLQRTGQLYQTQDIRLQTPISPMKSQHQLQQSSIHMNDSYMRQTDSFMRTKYSSFVRNSTSSIVEFLDIAKQITEIEEEIEDSKKQLARNLSFSPINLFKAFDSEGQSYLRYSKFCELLSAINIKFSDQEIGMIFSRIETDKDGFLSKDEFNEVFKPCDNDYIELFKNKPIELQEITAQESREIRFIMTKILDREKMLKKQMQQLRSNPNFEKFSIFNAIDENQDGQVNLAELAQAFRNYNILLKQSSVKLLFNLMDLDHNGLVRYAEFLEFIQS